MNQRVIITTRRRLEAKIEELIGLLDFLDGDPDLEDGGDAEPEETDQNGDEQDSSLTENDNIGGGQFAMGKIEGGCGL
ncbi:hypothetical protein NOJ05_13520 [Neorhizobium galegae]|uniref:hypothetical protein n=1 Tax=Neorhizobium galegae TaxID=399 RepID=UPI0021054956|nr:hypothetical protein [Neorhizobium galegae]MCQ1778221.1 hypothetical protein [Neorhizobium galegae]MCQ1796805.1 hypothetical protein [Neorhizobium galegae]